jgi:DNA-binding NarL/FixJ family response regulator
LIVAENPFARAGLAALLSERGDLTIVGQTASDPGLANLVDLYRPDVIVFEAAYETEGLELLRSELKDLAIPLAVLVADDTRAADALSAGARGVVLNTASASVLSAAVAALAQGLMVISPELRPNLNPAPEAALDSSPLDVLTTREQEVLRLLAEGLANKQIAVRLNISEHTVKFHVNAIMGKLGVQSRTEAVVRATRMGMIAL